MKTAIAWILIIAVLVIVGPLVTIWALNALFGLAIPFALKTWLAAAWLASVVAYRGKSSK